MKRLLILYGQYIAILLAVLGLSLFWYSRPPASRVIESELFRPEQEKMSALLDQIQFFGMAGLPSSQEDSLALALNHYAAADYVAAVSALEIYLKQYPGDRTARFYHGVSVLYLGEPGRAFRILLPLTELQNFELQDDACWYAAIAAAEAEPMQALGLFSRLSRSPGSKYQPAATAILEQMQSKDGAIHYDLNKNNASGYTMSMTTPSFWWQTDWCRLLFLTLPAAGISLFFWRIRVRKLQLEKEKLGLEMERSEALLHNILPAETANELKKYGYSDTRRHEMVTVLFCDFQGFTNIAEELSPEELVAHLGACFEAFDRIMTRFDLEKIKTVGDCYICAGGLEPGSLPHIPASSNADKKREAADQAVRVVKAARQMLAFLNEFNERQVIAGKPAFHARIGIHTGAVVAGIVGIKKYSYDIWGDTVNVAARMEQSGEAGRINISGDTFELVQEYFSCTYRGRVETKGKGAVDMYFVE